MALALNVPKLKPKLSLRMINQEDSDDSIKTTEVLGTTFYYKNTRSNGKPLYTCLDNAKKEGHKLIVSQQIKNNHMFGSYKDVKDLTDKVFFKKGIVNHHLRELLPEDLPRYMYIDLEWEQNHLSDLNVLTTPIEAIHAFNRVLLIAINELVSLEEHAFQDSVILSTATGTVDGDNIASQNIKHSYHQKVGSILFENQKSQQAFWHWFHHKIANNTAAAITDQYPEIEKDIQMLFWTKSKEGVKTTKSIYDMQVYGKNQQFKMLGQSKIGSDRIQLDENIYGNIHPKLSDHLVGHYENMDSIKDGVRLINTGNLKAEVEEEIFKAPSESKSGNFSEFMVLLQKPEQPRAIRQRRETESEIDYYLSFIPNSGEHEQHWQVWCVIGMICHNDCHGLSSNLQSWINWSKQATLGKYNIEDNCNSMWEKFRSGGGYTISTLKHMARICQPLVGKNDVALAIDEITSYGTQLIPEIYNQRYCLPYAPVLSVFSVLIEMSQMGSGKTTQTFNYLLERLRQNPELRILFLSPRTIFAQNITGELNDKVNGFAEDPDKEDWTCYTNVKKDHSDVDRLVIQMESIWKLNECDYKPYDIVVMDESESCLKQFSSEKTMTKLGKCVTAFERIIKDAGKIIICDAFISTRSINFVASLKKSDEIKFRVNEYQTTTRSAQYIKSKDVLLTQVLSDLKAGKRIFLVCATKTTGLAFEQHYIIPLQRSGQIKDFKYKFYHADTDDTYANDIGEVKKSWSGDPEKGIAGCNLIMTTPKITVGVNFDVPDYFNSCYIIGSCYSCSPRDIFQTHMRVRHLIDNQIYFTIEAKYYNINPRPKNLFYQKGEMSRYLYTQKSFLTNHEKLIFHEYPNDNKEDRKDKIKDSPIWLKNVHIHNQVEDSLTKLMYEQYFLNYLRKSGYLTLTFNSLKFKGKLEDTVVPLRSKDIADIDMFEYLAIDERKKFKEATQEDKLRFGKYLFKHVLSTKLSKEHVDELYDYNFIDQYHAERYWNLYYEWKHFNGLTTDVAQFQKDIGDKCYGDMISSSQNHQLKLLKMVFDILGLKHSQDTNAIVSSGNFKKLIDWIKIYKNEFEVVFNIKSNRKEGTSDPGTKIIIDTINQLLRKWGTTKLEQKRRRENINGQRVYVDPTYQLCYIDSAYKNKFTPEILVPTMNLFDVFKKPETGSDLLQNYLNDDETECDSKDITDIQDEEELDAPDQGKSN
jgi:hypothetical protein